MAKCLAIFKGTSVKLKTLVARSAVMFVFSTVKITFTNETIILIPFLFTLTLTLINEEIPFINDFFFIHSLLLLNVNGELVFCSIQFTVESVKI